MNPAPTLLDEWITNAAFWWFMLVAATTGVVWLLASLITAWRTQDAEPAPTPHVERECQITDCHNTPTWLFDRHPTGIFWCCTPHAHMVRDWAGPYDRTVDAIYNQELDTVEDYANGETA
jgi:hypothetical protein